MPFPIMYTFPISQFYSNEFATIRDYYRHHIMPMIKVSNLDQSENTEGIAVMKEIVKRRAALCLFDKDVLELLIEKTGGSLRDLFVCIVSAAERASWRGADRIETEDANRALSDLNYELTSRISRPDYHKLAEIHCYEHIRKEIPDREFLIEMMKALIVLEYRNSKRWHDLQPLIADFLIEQNIIAQFLKEQGDTDGSSRQ